VNTNKVRHYLALPAQWVMLLAYKIHLSIDGNSEYVCHTFEEEHAIELELAAQGLGALDVYKYKNG
jgi:hypothetical protein